MPYKETKKNNKHIVIVATKTDKIIKCLFNKMFFELQPGRDYPDTFIEEENIKSVYIIKDNSFSPVSVETFKALVL